MKKNTVQSSQMIAALELTWTAIQTHHPDTQPAIFTLYREKKGKNRGYYHAQQWRTTDKTKFDEVQIDSTILREGAESVLRTLIHEAAHSVNNKHKVQDVSRNAKYHNLHFKKTAEKMGLVCQLDKIIGVLTPKLADGTAKVYKAELATLSKAIKAYQEPADKMKGKETGRQLKAECDCGRIIRLSKTVAQDGSIQCLLCESLFTLSQ